MREPLIDQFQEFESYAQISDVEKSLSESFSTQGSIQDINLTDLVQVPMFVLGVFAQILIFGGVAFG